MRLLLGLIVHVSQHLGEETGQLQFAHQNILDTATSHWSKICVCVCVCVVAAVWRFVLRVSLP